MMDDDPARIFKIVENDNLRKLPTKSKLLDRVKQFINVIDEENQKLDGKLNCDPLIIDKTTSTDVSEEFENPPNSKISLQDQQAIVEVVRFLLKSLIY